MKFFDFQGSFLGPGRTCNLACLRGISKPIGTCFRHPSGTQALERADGAAQGPKGGEGLRDQPLPQLSTPP